MRWLLARSIVAALALFLATGGVAAAADSFVVIVHPSVTGSSVKRTDLAAVFLKQASRWGSGGLAVPVDQSGTSPVRKAFSDAVVQKPVAQVLQYWQKLMLSSSTLRPPPVKGTDAEVIAFVSKTAGAVGYVSPATALPPDVKPVALVD